MWPANFFSRDVTLVPKGCLPQCKLYEIYQVVKKV